MTEAASLDGDRLAQLIGNVCFAHVQVEFTLRWVYWSFFAHWSVAAPDLAPAQIPRFGRLCDECKKRLRLADVPLVVRNSGGKVLRAASDANRKRNRVVHDMWLTTETPASWNRFSFAPKHPFTEKATPHQMADVEQTLADLRRVAVRVGALHFALLETLPFFRNASMPSQLERWVDVMEDKFN